MSHRDTEAATNIYAMQLTVGVTVFSALLLFVYCTHYLHAIRVPLAYVLPVLLAYAITLAILAMSRGPSPLPWGPFLLGAFVIVGGPTLDISATLSHSPTLSREDNVVARSLLDSGHSIRWVLSYGLLAQAELVILICLLWAGFLKHKQTLLILARDSGATSAPSFVKAAMGGGALSWRQFFFPFKIAELPSWYHMLWFMAVILSGASVYRWYLGLEWFGIIRFNRILVVILAVLIPVIAYVVWLSLNYSKNPSPDVVKE